MSKRVNYFDRQFLRAGDLSDDQAFHIERRRLVQSGLFRPGIVTGLGVTVVDEPPNTLTVARGCAIDTLGRELVLSEETTHTLDRAIANGDRVWLAFNEEPTDEVAYLGAQNPMPTRIADKPLIVVTEGREEPEDAGGPAVPIASLHVRGANIVVRRGALAGPADATVSAASLATNAVIRNRIAPNAVGPRELADGAVTVDKLAETVVDELIERLTARLPTVTPDSITEAIARAVVDRLPDRSISSTKLTGFAGLAQSTPARDETVGAGSESAPTWKFVQGAETVPGQGLLYLSAVDVTGASGGNLGDDEGQELTWSHAARPIFKPEGQGRDQRLRLTGIRHGILVRNTGATGYELKVRFFILGRSED